MVELIDTYKPEFNYNTMFTNDFEVEVIFFLSKLPSPVLGSPYTQVYTVGSL